MKDSCCGSPVASVSASSPLIRRHASRLLTYIQRMIGDRHRSEELFQEVFLAVWSKRRQYKFPRPFRAWLFGIATNQCRSEFRKARPVIYSYGRRTPVAGHCWRSLTARNGDRHRNVRDRGPAVACLAAEAAQRRGFARLEQPFVRGVGRVLRVRRQRLVRICITAWTASADTLNHVCEHLSTESAERTLHRQKPDDGLGHVVV